MKQLLNVCRDQRIEEGEYKAMREMFEEIPIYHRHPLVTLAESVISNYIYIRNMKYTMQIEKEIPLDLEEQQIEIQDQLESSAAMIENIKQKIQCNSVDHVISNQELEEVNCSKL